MIYGLQWFNDVFSTEISDKCEDVLSRLLETHGCKVSFQTFLNSYAFAFVSIIERNYK